MRLERSEAANRRLINEQIDDAFERAREVAEGKAAEGNGGDLVQQMAGAFMSGALQPKPTAPGPVKTNGKPNGKGHA
jgi:hypothetical protein